MDLYRISSAEELEDAGGVELMSSTGISVIEWAEHAEKVLPDDTVRVVFEILDGSRRRITVNGTGV